MTAALPIAAGAYSVLLRRNAGVFAFQNAVVDNFTPRNFWFMGVRMHRPDTNPCALSPVLTQGPLLIGGNQLRYARKR